MKKRVKKIFLCFGVVASLMFSATGFLLACCNQEPESAHIIDGTWLVRVVFDDNSSQQEITVSAFPPLLVVRSDKGFCVPGFLLPKDDGFIVLWRCRTPQGNTTYKGSTRLDPCSSGSSDMETVLAGTAVASPLFGSSKVGRFIAYKRHTLRVAVSPDASGTVTSDSGTIACGSDCIEEYIGGCRRITLRAEPSEGWMFKHWQIGDTAISDNNLINLRINADLDVLAVFVKSGA